MGPATRNRVGGAVDALVAVAMWTSVVAPFLLHVGAVTMASGIPLRRIHRRESEEPLGRASCGLWANPLPKCAVGIFVHVEKTGGTTTRFFLQKQKGYEYRKVITSAGLGLRGGDFWMRSTVPWASVLRELVSTNTNFRHHHPRIILELHGGGNLPSILKDVRKLRNSSAFRAAGCKAVVFTSARHPYRYLLSHLHDSFRHSFYRRTFLRYAAPETEYFQPNWHGKLSQFAGELKDLQVKAFARYFNVKKWDAGKAPTLRQLESIHAALEAMDIVGITEQADELYVHLINALGLQGWEYDIVGASGKRVTKLLAKHPEWEDENVVIAKVANESSGDASLYAHALQLAEHHARALPGGKQMLECEKSLLREVNRPENRIHRAERLTRSRPQRPRLPGGGRV